VFKRNNDMPCRNVHQQRQGPSWRASSAGAPSRMVKWRRDEGRRGTHSFIYRRSVAHVRQPVCKGQLSRLQCVRKARKLAAVTNQSAPGEAADLSMRLRIGAASMGFHGLGNRQDSGSAVSRGRAATRSRMTFSSNSLSSARQKRAMT
jgi:hypothetical protein